MQGIDWFFPDELYAVHGAPPRGIQEVAEGD